MRKALKVNNALSQSMGYNPYRDSEGKFDDGPTLLASRGRPKVDSAEQRKKIEAAKAKLRKQYELEDTKPEREKVLEGPKYVELAGFKIGEDTISANEVRTILWKDKDLFPGKTYGEYYETEKAQKGDIFMMTPAEYRQALIESGQYKDLAGIERRMDWDKVEQYAEDMQSGDKFPPGQLIYDQDGSTSQEGLHRIYAAERVGIEKVPIVVTSDTRNQNIYPYQKLSSAIMSQDEIHGKKQEEEDAELIKPVTPIDSPTPGAEEEPEEVDNPDVRDTFYGLSSLGGEHTDLIEKKKDPALTFTEEEAIEEQIKQIETDMRAETDKVLDAIKSAPASSDFLEELASTIEAEQEIANRNGDELYLTALDKIVLAIGKKQGNPDKKENKASKKVVNQISARDFPDLYEDLDIDTDDLGCIMLDLEPMKVMEYMEGHEDDVFENPKWDQGSVPAETVPHVTLLYGLLENGNVWKEKVDKLLKDWSVKTVKIDKVGFFDTPDSYAVVAHLVKTPELVDGHERLTLLPHVNTFSEYLPHMTLAYVKKDADVDVWVKNLGKQYNGKTVKATGINYGDKSEKDGKGKPKGKNGLDALRSSLASLGQDHNSISQSGLIVAYNALDSESRDIIKSQENALKAGFQNIERRIVAAATERVAKNYLEDASDLITKTERKKFEQETQALLTTFYINLYPIFGRQLLAKRASEYGVMGTYQMNASTQAYIEEMAEKAAVSHVNTVIQDLLVASSLVYAVLVTAALVGLVTAALSAGNVRIKKKLLDSNYTEEQIEQAVEAGVFDDTDMYKEAQSLARKGEGQAKIVQTIQNKYQDISKNRATTIARTESARVFNQSQFEADKQFLNDAGLMDKAYKKLRSRTGTPCDHCEMLINKPPIPFMKNFADLGSTLRAVETKPDGTVKVKTLPVNWEAISAGNVHPNCNCEYVLIIKDN